MEINTDDLSQQDDAGRVLQGSCEIFGYDFEVWAFAVDRDDHRNSIEPDVDDMGVDEEAFRAYLAGRANPDPPGPIELPNLEGEWILFIVPGVEQ